MRELGMRRVARGFTLIELLVVIALILILLGLVLPALLAARRQQKIIAAGKDVQDIAAAAAQYHERLGVYPPDTGNDGSPYTTGDVQDAVIDAGSIYKYLGREITDSRTNEHFGPFLTCKPNQLKRIGSDPIYLDPWGTPYHMDCMHIQISPDKVGKNVGQIIRVGEPYPANTPDDKIVREVKVWSNGPDKAMSEGSNRIEGRGTELDDDNAESWD